MCAESWGSACPICRQPISERLCFSPNSSTPIPLSISPSRARLQEAYQARDVARLARSRASLRLEEDENDAMSRLACMYLMHLVGMGDFLRNRSIVWRFACFLVDVSYSPQLETQGPIVRDAHLNPCNAFVDITRHSSQLPPGGKRGLLQRFPAVAICCGMWENQELRVHAQQTVMLRLVEEGAAILSLRPRYGDELRQAVDISLQMHTQ